MQFVVLHHTGVEPAHFDLMLDTHPDAPLATWRCPRWPIDRPACITRLADHRRDYLTYEGPLSEARGEVKRIASGQCELIRHDDDSFWTIIFADPTRALLHLKLADGDQWLAMPNCGG